MPVSVSACMCMHVFVGISVSVYMYILICKNVYVSESESLWGCPHGVMVKVIYCEIVLSEFVLQSRYYVHVRANTHVKGTNPLILPVMV